MRTRGLIAGAAALVLAVATAGAAVADFAAGSGFRASDNFAVEDVLGGLTGPLAASDNWQMSAGPLNPEFVLPQIASMRLGGDYQLVTLYSKTVTAGTEDFSTALYVEDDSALAGIRVDRTFLPSASASKGDWVDVQGTLLTSSQGERYIRLQKLTRRFGAQPLPVAWKMAGKVLGGGPAGETPGINGAYGLNNVGLLVQAWGTVSFVDGGGQFFYLDDGSGLSDGSGLAGATGGRVLLSGLASGNSIAPPAKGSFVILHGISSTQKIGGKVVRALRPRVQADIWAVE